MTRRRHLIVALFLFALSSASARAQDAPRVGLTIGYPASVGLLWRISDRVAVRPDLAFSWTSSEPSVSASSSIGVSSNDSTRTTVGISGLIYVGKWEALRAYVAPRFGYSRTTSTFESTSTITSFNSLSPVLQTTTSTTITTGKGSAYETSGAFGAEYTLGRRFAVFAEVGLAVTHVSSVSISTNASRAPSVPAIDSGGKGVATRSGIGAIFYF